MLKRTAYKMKPPVSARLISGHPLADKLIACYLMNEGSGLTAFDSSGRGHHGTLTGGVTWTMGKYGPAIDFDGTDGCIIIPDHDDFSPVGTQLSIGARVYIEDENSFSVVSKGVYNTSGEWRVITGTGGILEFTQFDESEDSCYIGRKHDTSLAAYVNQWVYLTATYDGGDLSSGSRLYLAGVRFDDADREGNPVPFDSVENGTAPVHIGRREAFYADGRFSYLMMWRRVLTASDVVKLYADPFCMFARSSRLLVTI